MKLTLYRTPSTQHGTFGILCHGAQPLCVTLEDPWKNNEQNISCILAGLYECKAYSSKKFPDVWEILDVPGRSFILFHAGNTQKDTEGCILVGKGFGARAVLRSREALDALRKYLPDTFTVDIKEPYKRPSFWGWLFFGKL